MAIAREFVQTRGTKFALNGQTFPVVGVNCYFLSYCSDAARVETISSILRMEANVVRSVAFRDQDLERLDALIEAAEQFGFRLILPLVNYWPDLGGMSMYLDSLFPGRILHVTEFYRRPEARAAYREWVAQVVNRINSRTGVAYRDSPAILAWELANEPRCPIPGGRELLLDWAGEMARFVKQQDSNHLVSLGDEGFLRRPRRRNHLYDGSYGVDFDAILDIPEIDFGTYRFYPGAEAMNVRKDFARTWIAGHVAAGARVNKPVVLEEYGLAADRSDPFALAERDRWYGQWLDAVYVEGGAGDLLWMMGCTEASVAGNRDGYTIYSAAEVPSVVSHARAMRSRADSED